MTLASRRLALALALCVPAVSLVACGDDTPPAAPVEPTDRPLVGTWQGPGDGPYYGEATVTLVLEADGSDSTMAADLYYPARPTTVHVEGVWTVSGTQFTATGHDCIGNPMTIAAPASRSHLVGTWIVGDGTDPAERGWFDVSKH
jgi:hypothetical protein